MMKQLGFLLLLSFLALVRTATLPLFTTEPQDEVAQSGDTFVTLKCLATGNPNPSYKWEFNGNEVDVPSDSNLQLSSSGGDLIISTYSDSYAGNYVCVASNSEGSINSRTAKVATAYIDPAFTQDLVGQTVLTNTKLTVTCTIGSLPEANINFLFKGSPLNVNTDARLTKTDISMGSQLTIDPVQFSDDGTYQCQGTNPKTSDVQLGNPVTISVEGPPEFSPPPASQSVPERETLYMDCVVLSNPSATVTWENGSNFVFPSASLPRFRVESNNTLIVTNVEKGDGGVYTCKASNKFGVKSAQAKLTVTNPLSTPALIKSFSDQTVLVNSLVLLDCEASGNPSPLITWSKDGQPLVFAPPRVEYLSNQGKLRISSVTVNDEGRYNCSATNVKGSATVSANLIVQVVPVITSNFNDQTVDENKAISETCIATGRPNPSIHWTDPNGKTLFGSFSHILSLGSLQQSASGTYTCVAQNAAGQTQKSFKLTVQGKPSVSVSPSSITVSVGSDVKISCQATGDPTPTLRWTLSGGTPLPNNNRFSVLSNGDLEIKAVLQTDSATYDCRGTNRFGEVIVSAILTVNVAPSFVLRPSDTEVIQGRTATLQCVANGVPSYEWLLPNGTTIRNRGRYRIVSGILSIQSMSAADQGSYTCIASNAAGKVLSAATLTMITLPTFVTQPSNSIVIEGQSLTLTCSAKGINTPTITWYKVPTKGQPQQLTGPRYTFQSGGDVEIKQAKKADDDGAYRCEAKNRAGTATTQANVTVHIKPTVVIQPTNLVIDEGQGNEWKCVSTSGDPAPTFRWTKSDSSPLPSARFTDHKDGRLTVQNARVEDNGRYTCTGENDVGRGSSEGTIEIHVPPAINSVSANVAIVGGVGVLDCNATGKPSPQIRWFFSSFPLPIVGRLKMAANQSLIINPVQGADAGTFRCEATNSVGKTTKDVEFFIKSVPGRPTAPQAIDIGSNDVTLQWTVPSDGRSSITGHVIDYFTRNTDWVTLPIDFNANTTQTIRGLQGNTEYFFRVAAKNAVGTSQQSLDSLLIKTEIGPPSAPNSVSVTAREATMIQVSWTSPRQLNGDIRLYEIVYEPTANQSVSLTTSPVTIQRNATSQMRVNLTGLVPHVTYVVSVRASNSRWGPYAHVTATTLESKPTGYPQNIQLNASLLDNGVAIIQVTWKPPPKSEQNGVLTQYRIVYTPLVPTATPSSFAQGDFTHVSAEETSIILDVIANTVYDVIISAVNSEGAGPFSPPKRILTPKVEEENVGGLGTGSISAIIVGSICFILLILLIAFLVYYRNTRRRATMNVTIGGEELGNDESVGGGGGKKGGRSSKYIADSPDIQVKNVKGKFARKKSQRKSPLTEKLVQGEEMEMDGGGEKGEENPYADVEETEVETPRYVVGDVSAAASRDANAKKERERAEKERKKEERKRRQEEEKRIKRAEREKKTKAKAAAAPKRFKDIDLSSQKGKQQARKFDAQSASLF